MKNEYPTIESARPLTVPEFSRAILGVLEETLFALKKKEDQLASSAKLTKFLIVLPALALMVNYAVDGTGQAIFWSLLGLAIISAGYVEDRRRETIRETAYIESELCRRHIQVKRNTEEGTLCIVPIKWADNADGAD